MLLLVYGSLSTTRLKRVRRLIVLAPLLLGLTLTTLVRAANVDANSSDQAYEFQQVFDVLDITGVALIVIGVCAVLSKVRYWTLLLPTDAPFEAYKPFKPAYPSKFATNPIPPPLFEPNMLSIGEAARYLRISEHDVWQLIDEGSIIAVKRGMSYVITRRALDDFAHAEKFGL
jgi:excisionase family DNA binding protein